MQLALAAWSRGHRIRPRTKRPGFEPLRGIQFFRGKCPNRLNMHCLCVEKEKYVKAVAHTLI
jgi:hypothetical protein